MCWKRCTDKKYLDSEWYNEEVVFRYPNGSVRQIEQRTGEVIVGTIDFDRDGIREPFEWPDVLASMANYLVKNGYSLKENNFSKDSPNWKSIYRYNPSENYVNVILDLRTQIMKNID